MKKDRIDCELINSLSDSSFFLRVQFPLQSASCNSGNQLTEWGQLLISELGDPLILDLKL